MGIGGKYGISLYKLQQFQDQGIRGGYNSTPDLSNSQRMISDRRRREDSYRGSRMTFKSSAAAPLQAGRFDQAVKMKIDMISDHIKQQGYTSEKFYSFLDKDGAGEISLV